MVQIELERVFHVVISTPCDPFVLLPQEGNVWVCFLSHTCSLYGCRRSVFGGGAALNKCALYVYVQCLGASALCPEVCTKIIFSKSLKKVLSFKGRLKRDGKLMYVYDVSYRRRKEGDVVSV